MVVATYAQLCTLVEKVTSYWPVPIWVTPVTPLPWASAPAAVTLANRLLLAACAGVALTSPAIAGAASATAAPAADASLASRENIELPPSSEPGPRPGRDIACHHACIRCAGGVLAMLLQVTGFPRPRASLAEPSRAPGGEAVQTAS